LAKFRHFGYFLRPLAKFFLPNFAKEIGDFFGYFPKLAKILHFYLVKNIFGARIFTILATFWKISKWVLGLQLIAQSLINTN